MCEREREKEMRERDERERERHERGRKTGKSVVFVMNTHHSDTSCNWITLAKKVTHDLSCGHKPKAKSVHVGLENVHVWQKSMQAGVNHRPVVVAVKTPKAIRNASQPASRQTELAAFWRHGDAKVAQTWH